MESFAFGLGFLLAIFGPLLLIPITWGVHRWITKALVLPWLAARFGKLMPPLFGVTLSVGAVGLTLALSYFPGKFEFNGLCTRYSKPQVQKRVMVDGFYRTRLYPYEAARFLREEGFAFVEAPHMYKKNIYVRYSMLADGKVREQETTELVSQYGVREDFSQPSYGILMNQKTVYQIASSRQFANAAGVTYTGGPLSLLLGTYALSSCPDIRTPSGSEDFKTYYHLEKAVLRASAKK